MDHENAQHLPEPDDGRDGSRGSSAADGSQQTSLRAWVASRPDSPAGVPPAVMVVALDGLYDAAGAASGALAWAAAQLGGDVVGALDPEDYYDFQVHRPHLEHGPHGSRIAWVSTTLTRADGAAGCDVLLMQGAEPSFKWRGYASEILTLAEENNVQAVITLNSLLADVPHTRPLPTFLSSGNELMRGLTGAEDAGYDGPLNAAGFVREVAESAGIPTLGIYATVPRYVGAPPSPKAQLSLVAELDAQIGLQLSTDDLRADAEAWQRGADDLAEQDPRVAELLQTLEQAEDPADHPEASGEAIAREFERYLNNRGEDGRGPGQR